MVEVDYPLHLLKTLKSFKSVSIFVFVFFIESKTYVHGKCDFVLLMKQKYIQTIESFKQNQR